MGLECMTPTREQIFMYLKGQCILLNNKYTPIQRKDRAPPSRDHIIPSRDNKLWWGGGPKNQGRTNESDNHALFGHYVLAFQTPPPHAGTTLLGEQSFKCSFSFQCLLIAMPITVSYLCGHKQIQCSTLSQCLNQCLVRQPHTEPRLGGFDKTKYLLFR